MLFVVVGTSSVNEILSTAIVHSLKRSYTQEGNKLFEKPK
jgi:hypothetical protein